MMLNEDYKDMLRAFSDEKVKFILVGAYAMAVQGYPRSTMDIDIWVATSAENADAVLRALIRFGAPTSGLCSKDFQTDGMVFQIGVAPKRIDIITTATGLDFADTLKRSTRVVIDGIQIPVLSIDDLIRNKKATGRRKDIIDVEVLESLKNSK